MTAVTVHGTAVCFGRRGVLIRGQPGSGKSSLALALIDAAGFGFTTRSMRARLVADDQVELSRAGKTVRLKAPKNLAGLIEIRGHGIQNVPAVSSADLVLVVDLLPAAKIDRLPDEDDRFTSLLDIKLPRLMLPIGDPIAPSRLRAVLQTR